MIIGPEIRVRPAIPYAAIQRSVTLPFGPEIGPILDQLFAALEANGLAPAGPVFFKHNVIDMPHIVMEFGVPLAAPAKNVDGLVTGTLPAGRFGELTHFGHYDGLFEANGRLIDWAREQGIHWDCRSEADGDHFACRLEIYLNSPMEEPNPDRLETVVTIRIRD